MIVCGGKNFGVIFGAHGLDRLSAKALYLRGGFACISVEGSNSISEMNTHVLGVGQGTSVSGYSREAPVLD